MLCKTTPLLFAILIGVCHMVVVCQTVHKRDYRMTISNGKVCFHKIPDTDSKKNVELRRKWMLVCLVHVLVLCCGVVTLQRLYGCVFPEKSYSVV